MTMSHMERMRDGHDQDFLYRSTFTIDSGFQPKVVYRNLCAAKLYAKALAYEPNTHITSSGALATITGGKTGRSPHDKRIVREPEFEQHVWWGPHSPNYEMDERTFLMNREAAVDYLNVVDRVYVVDGYANWDLQCRKKIRIICSREHHALFALNMLIQPTPQQLADFHEPDFVIWNAGAFAANRYNPYMTSRTSISISIRHREVVILGTEYAGEMKKGVFTLLHYYTPQPNMLFLHSGCNVGAGGDVTLFFGLSGTGKTALSSDPLRMLIGDDEHCWGKDGVFNLEGGCYAKCVGLSAENEPDVHAAVNRFGTLLENVVMDSNNHEVDYDDMSVTENMRACFPLNHIRNAQIPCVGDHPRNILLLCCDVFGVLPPVSRLSLEQTLYHFISGYTAKVAGTEVGICEPQAIFSPCYAGAFIMWHPVKYAALLADKITAAGTNTWLINTGWQGGRPGIGERINIKYTRAMIDAIHGGQLDAVEYEQSPVFNLAVPSSCPGVPSGILHPELHWDKDEFSATLSHLGELFTENFTAYYEDGAAIAGRKFMDRILSGGPRLCNGFQQRQQQQQQQSCAFLASEIAADQRSDQSLMSVSGQLSQIHIDGSHHCHHGSDRDLCRSDLRSGDLRSALITSCATASSSYGSDLDLHIQLVSDVGSGMGSDPDLMRKEMEQGHTAAVAAVGNSSSKS